MSNDMAKKESKTCLQELWISRRQGSRERDRDRHLGLVSLIDRVEDQRLRLVANRVEGVERLAVEGVPLAKAGSVLAE